MESDVSFEPRFYFLIRTFGAMLAEHSPVDARPRAGSRRGNSAVNHSNL
jgi:hypothetical protein